MAVLTNLTERSTQRGSWYQNCLDPNLLKACKPSAEKVSVIRPIPEIHSDGSIRPMVNAITPAGYDFTNLVLESVSINVGLDSKYSGLNNPSDRPTTDDLSMVFPGLYVRVKSAEKNNRIPAHLRDTVARAFTKPEKSDAPLSRAKTMGLMQCLVLKLNDQEFDTPQHHQCAFLTGLCCETIAEVLTKAHNDGIDVFSPADGRTIIIKGLPPDRKAGRHVCMFQAELGEPCPVDEETCRGLWVPWEKALKRHTYEQHIEMAISCYGSELVEFAYPNEVKALMMKKQREAVAVAATVAPAAKPVVAKPTAPAPTKPATKPAPLKLDISKPPVDLEAKEEPAPVPAAKPAAAAKPTLSAKDPEEMAREYAALIAEEGEEEDEE